MLWIGFCQCSSCSSCSSCIPGKGLLITHFNSLCLRNCLRATAAISLPNAEPWGRRKPRIHPHANFSILAAASLSVHIGNVHCTLHQDVWCWTSSVGTGLLSNTGMVHHWHRLLDIFVFKAVSKRRRGGERALELRWGQFGYPRAGAGCPTLCNSEDNLLQKGRCAWGQQSLTTLMSCSVSVMQKLSEQEMDQQKEQSSSGHSPSLEARRCHHPPPYEHTANPSSLWIQACWKAHVSNIHTNASPSGSE